MGCLQRNMDELWLFCHWNRTREVVFSLWSVENCHLFKRESLITLNKTASGVGTTFLHLDWLHIRKEMRSLSKCSQHRQAGHLKGLFVTRPHLPGSRVFLPLASWPFGDDSCGNWTGLSQFALLTLCSWGWSCWARHPWVGGREILWRRNRTWPVLSWRAIPGPLSSLTLSPFKNSPPLFTGKGKADRTWQGLLFLNSVYCQVRAAADRGRIWWKAPERNSIRPK